MQHAIADYLSQLESGEEGTRIKDNFPDGQLFWVATVVAMETGEDTMDTWIIEMTIFLKVQDYHPIICL